MLRVVPGSGGFGRADEGPEHGAGQGRTPIRDPEVAELRAFVAAATLGSIAAAARSLNVSQPALSKRLRTLEAVAGARLFERSTRGVKLTPPGIHLYGAARRLLNTADTVSALISGPTAPKTVRLASSPVIAEMRLPEILADLAALEASSVAVEVVVANSRFVRQLLVEDRCDLAIVALDPERPPENGIRGKVLWRDEVVIAVPPGHPWLSEETVPLEEFVTAELVEGDPFSNSTLIVATALEHAGIPAVAPYASVGGPRAVIATALRSGRPAVVSAMVARAYESAGLSIRRVEGMFFDREFALLWSGPLPALKPHVQKVAQHLLDLPFSRSRQINRESDEL